MSKQPPGTYIAMSENEVEELIAKTVNATLTQLGIDHSDPMEMQRDFQHLRSWRKSTEQIKNRGVLAALGIVVTGIMAALWVGFKQFLVE